MRNSFLLIFLFVINSFCFGQEYLLDIQKLTAEDGLANMQTFASFKDSKGYLWISTKYGLNRYDGYEFKLYTKEQNGLFSNSLIQRIEEDQEGNIWLFHLVSGTKYQLAAIDIFNPTSGEVVPIQEYIGDLPFNLADVYLSKDKPDHQRMWIYDSRGQVFFYKNKTFNRLFTNPGKAIQTVAETKDGFFVGSENELIHLDLNGQVLKKEVLPETVHRVWATDSTLWLLTQQFTDFKADRMFDYTVWRKSREDSAFEIFLFENNDILKKRQGAFFYRDRKGLWYLDGGKYFNKKSVITVFDPSGKKIFDLQQELETNLSLEAAGFLETDEHLWLASSTGLLQLNITKNPFRIVHTREDLSDARGITEDERGNIYFLNGSIFQYHPINQTVRKLSSASGAFDLIYRTNQLHAGSYANKLSLFNYDLNTQKENFSPPWKGYSPVHYFHKTASTDLYLLGSINGLSYFDFNNNEGRPFLKYNAFEELKNYAVYHFHENESGIWLATENGIYLMKKDERIVRRFNKSSGDLPFNHIRHISEKPKGVFWLATSGGGILRWEPASEEKQSAVFRQFTTADGLSNNYTYAVYPDDYGSLWIPSDQGLMQMNSSDFQIKTYLKEDGLPHNEFNLSSHYKAKDGTFYFGGLGGLISFHPKDFAKRDIFEAPMNFTGFHLWEDGQEKMTDKTSSLATGEAIEIRPDDKLFELRFALVDFDQKENHRYAYQIEGFDDRPNLIKENFIRITNLPYGAYQLKIKGQNITKGWSQQELRIPIHVLKPFYLQWWFITVMILAGIGLIFTYFLSRERRLRKEGERLETEVKNRTQTIQQQTEELKELDKAKTRFFSNITHEFRTPLTLILGPSQQLAQNDKIPIPIRKKIWNISKNAQQLLALINQMLDISKIEGGLMQVEVIKGEIISFIKELTEQFVPMAEVQQQQLNFISSENSWETNFDKDKLSKIISNLLSNALKFTEAKGTINVFLEKNNGNTILIKVEDKGIGMSPEQMNRIFDRFYQADETSTRTNEGTGIGLSLVKELVDLLGGKIEVLSKLGAGTTFQIILPVLEITKKQILFKEKIIAPDLLKSISPIEVLDLPDKQEPELSTSEKLDLLIIEDNEGIHEYIHSCIDLKKYNIYTAFDGEQGVQKAFELIPDLIISDIMMPKKDGFDVTTAIRNNITTSHIPLILLTAKSSLKNRLQGLQRGADAYLTKPFSPQELSIRIEKLIEIRQILQTRYRGKTEFEQDKAFQKEDAFVRKIKTYIFENIENTNLNGDVIGKHFGISRMHIYRKLKALTNQPISEMIKEIRLTKAMELLQDKSNDLNITEITYKTGFSSISYFSRVFKKKYGKAPSEV